MRNVQEVLSSLIAYFTQLLRRFLGRGQMAAPTDRVARSRGLIELENSVNRPPAREASVRIRAAALSHVVAERTPASTACDQKGVTRQQPSYVSDAVPAEYASRPDDLLRFELEAEMRAEEYFHEARGKAAAGHFVAIEHVNFAHEETEWDVGDLLFEAHPPAPRPGENPPAILLRARRTVGPASPQNSLRIAIERLHKEANIRSWLSPKSRSALEKLKRCDAKLVRSELNALEYLLSKATGISRLKGDIDRIRSHITD